MNLELWEDVKRNHLFLRSDAQIREKITNFFVEAIKYNKTLVNFRVKIHRLLTEDFKEAMSECFREGVAREVYGKMEQIVSNWGDSVIEGLLKKADNAEDDSEIKSFEDKLLEASDISREIIGGLSPSFTTDTVSLKIKEFWKGEVDKLMEDATFKALARQRDEVLKEAESLAKYLQDKVRERPID